MGVRIVYGMWYLVYGIWYMGFLLLGNADVDECICELEGVNHSCDDNHL